jgi:hypothetical protein
MLPSHTVWIIWQKVATISLLTKHWAHHVTGEFWSFHSGYDTMNFTILPWSSGWTWRQQGNMLTEYKGLTVRDEVSHPYKATGEVIVLWSAEVYRWKYTIHFSHPCLWISLDTFCYQRPRRFLSRLVKVKLYLCFNWAPRHGGVLGVWRYSSTDSLTSALQVGSDWENSRQDTADTFSITVDKIRPLAM